MPERKREKQESEKSLPIVALSVPFSPFQYDKTLPKLEQPESGLGAIFVKEFLLRGVDVGVIIFDYDPEDTEIFKHRDAVIITKEGVVFAQKGERTKDELKDKLLFSISIFFDFHQTAKMLDWSIAFPKFHFQATKSILLIDRVVEFSQFKDQESGRVVEILVPYDLSVLKELQVVFRAKDNILPKQSNF